MKQNTELREKYSQLVQGMAAQLANYTADYRPYASDPLEATWRDNEGSMQELETICKELDIAMPFRDRHAG